MEKKPTQFSIVSIFKSAPDEPKPRDLLFCHIESQMFKGESAMDVWNKIHDINYFITNYWLKDGKFNCYALHEGTNVQRKHEQLVKYLKRKVSSRWRYLTTENWDWESKGE